jgi:hypothetical protein
MMTKFIGGPYHGKVLDLDFDDDRFTVSVLRPQKLDILDWPGHTIPTLAPEPSVYKRVYYSHQLRCVPMEYKGRQFMLLEGMEPAESRTLMRIERQIYMERALKR